MRLIAILTALLEDHKSVDEPGTVYDAGDAKSVHAGTGTTVTVAEQRAVTPIELVTVPVYEVVKPGLTDKEPPATGVFAPIPWLTLKLTPPVEVQVSVEALPAVMAVGDAARVQLGTPMIVTVAVQLVEPLTFVAV